MQEHRRKHCFNAQRRARQADSGRSLDLTDHDLTRLVRLAYAPSRVSDGSPGNNASTITKTREHPLRLLRSRRGAPSREAVILAFPQRVK